MAGEGQHLVAVGAAHRDDNQRKHHQHHEGGQADSGNQRGQSGQLGDRRGEHDVRPVPLQREDGLHVDAEQFGGLGCDASAPFATEAAPPEGSEKLHHPMVAFLASHVSPLGCYLLP
ncbi:MAG: hypothetical protein QOK39_2728 [Acidimicrobiaceae bacterium]|nr:hypothetical protein [Acidimicrobiaceae bacterium]